MLGKKGLSEPSGAKQGKAGLSEAKQGSEVNLG